MLWMHAVSLNIFTWLHFVCQFFNLLSLCFHPWQTLYPHWANNFFALAICLEFQAHSFSCPYIAFYTIFSTVSTVPICVHEGRIRRCFGKKSLSRRFYDKTSTKMPFFRPYFISMCYSSDIEQNLYWRVLWNPLVPWGRTLRGFPEM